MMKNLFTNIAHNQKLCLFLIFALFFAIFSLIQFSSYNLADVDPYYHIKYAELFRTLGIKETLNNFSVGEYTILNQYPTDLSFFYHILLIPFTFGDLIIGSKISAILFASLIFAAFAWILKKFQIKYSFFWTLLLFAASSQFIFRLILPRAFVLSILFLILGFYLITKKKYSWLFILSVFYALTYTASPLILVISFFYLITEYIQTKKFDWKLLVYPAAGILIGLIIRPDFPQNIYTIFVQNFYVLFYKLKGVKLNIGAELYPISANLSDNLILLILFDLSLAFLMIDFIGKRIKKDASSLIRLYTFILALFFCLLTLISQRFFEYWTPFTLFFAAFSFKYISEDRYWRNLIVEFFKVVQKFFAQVRRLKTPTFIGLCLIIIYSGYFNASLTIASLKETDFSFDKYQGAGQWLKKNTLQGSIVFNSSWDNFPQLFFYSHQNYYLVGMDPTFMYLYDQKLYWLWRNMTMEGVVCDQPEEKCPNLVFSEKISQRQQKIYLILKNQFQSEYIFIHNRQWGEKSKIHQTFLKFLENSRLFEKVYQDEKYPEVMIFQLADG